MPKNYSTQKYIDDEEDDYYYDDYDEEITTKFVKKTNTQKSNQNLIVKKPVKIVVESPNNAEYLKQLASQNNVKMFDFKTIKSEIEKVKVQKIKNS